MSAASRGGEGDRSRDADEEPDEPSRVEVYAELDVPGETGRQTKVFASWFACMVLAVVAASAVGAHVAPDDDGTARATLELSRSRAAKAKVALAFGLLLPAVLTLGIGRRYRRGGGHARGITVDVTEGGELRIWGRGYGARIPLAGAEVSERLVDEYAGRLGAWRQRRLRVRATTAGKGGGAREIELAATAREGDQGEGLAIEGGEGDCVELSRDDFDRVRAAVLEGVRGAVAAT